MAARDERALHDGELLKPLWSRAGSLAGVAGGARIALVLHPRRDPGPVLDTIGHWVASHGSRLLMRAEDAARWDGEAAVVSAVELAEQADVVVVREGKNLKGHLLGFVLGTIGKGVLEKAFENPVKAIEARS